MRRGGGVGGELGVPAAHQPAQLLPGNGREMGLIKTQVIHEPRHSFASQVISHHGKKKKERKRGGGRA